MCGSMISSSGWSRRIIRFGRLDALREREPENEFTLVIGADNLESFPRWRDYGRILREYGVVVFPEERISSRAFEGSVDAGVSGV
jgi:Nicotinic acid mononucleotide adenylyltransferase